MQAKARSEQDRLRSKYDRSVSMSVQEKRQTSIHLIVASIFIEGELLCAWDKLGAHDSEIGSPIAPARFF